MTEDSIYDSYAMRKFARINFKTESVPDETTLCRFCHLLKKNELNKLFFDAINRVMDATMYAVFAYANLFMLAMVGRKLREA